MPQVKFEKQISLDSDLTFTKVKDLISNAGELKKVDPSLGFEVLEDQKTIQATGQKISGQITVTPAGEQSTVTIDLNIPWSFAPFKGLIQTKLEEKINEIC